MITVNETPCPSNYRLIRRRARSITLIDLSANFCVLGDMCHMGRMYASVHIDSRETWLKKWFRVVYCADWSHCCRPCCCRPRETYCRRRLWRRWWSISLNTAAGHFGPRVRLFIECKWGCGKSLGDHDHDQRWRRRRRCTVALFCKWYPTTVRNNHGWHTELQLQLQQ